MYCTSPPPNKIINNNEYKNDRLKCFELNYINLFIRVISLCLTVLCFHVLVWKKKSKQNILCNFFSLKLVSPSLSK